MADMQGSTPQIAKNPGVSTEATMKLWVGVASALVLEYSQLNTADMVPVKKALHDDGYILVRGVPGYAEARESFYEAAWQFALLSDQDKQAYSPANSYARGWDRGIEQFNGQKDLYKGSYYANLPDNDQNMWPHDKVPIYQQTYLQLANLIKEVGVKILHRLDLANYEVQAVGRALDYKAIPTDDADTNPFWCGEHQDRGAWTGLASPIYVDPLTGKRHPEPAEGGLHVRKQKVTIPEDCMVFQVGKITQLLSNDETQATWHHVAKVKGLERLTMAVFMTPPDDYVIWSTSNAFPERFVNGMTYLQWTKASPNWKKN